MKFFHTADLHLGAKNKLLSSEDQELLKSERLQKLKDFFDKANSEKVDFVLICGDLFHSKAPQPKLVKSFFEMVKNCNSYVVYIKGNHDEKFEINSSPENFIILDNSRPCVSIGDADIWSVMDKNIIKNNMDKSRKNILMLHGDVENASDNDFVDIKEFFDLPFDYVAMGHIHYFKAFSLYQKYFVYSGSLFSNGFDECNEKGYVEVNIEDKTNFDFCPLEGRYYRICEVDITRLNSNAQIIDKIKNEFNRQNIRNIDVVRVVLTGYSDENDDKNLTLIKNNFYDQFYFEIVDKTKFNIDLESLKKETLSFKAEFIRLVEESSLSENDKNTICRLGIEALKGEDLSI